MNITVKCELLICVVLQTFSVFSIRTRQCRFLVRTTTEKEEDTYDWLYALDPLLVGSIRYGVLYCTCGCMVLCVA